MAKTITAFAQKKAAGERISMLTAYDYSTAKLIDKSGVDSILVGDSLGNVVLGYETTIPVTVDDMIHHGAAVCRGAKDTLVVVDMPFMSYQASIYDAMVNAGRIMKETGCAAVKLEGGVRTAPTIKALVDAGIPVCAHVGLTPQSVNAFGGFKVQGKSLAAARELVEDVKAVEEAGAFAVVLECVPAELATFITEHLDIPTIGIGAGAGCDGQVLVYQDMLGMFNDYVPKFVKQFAQVGEVMTQAFNDYHREVAEGSFPTASKGYTLEDGVIDELAEEYK